MAELRRQLEEARRAGRRQARAADTGADDMSDVAEEEPPSTQSAEELQREISVLESLADDDGAIARIVASKRERLATIRGRRRAAMPAWQAMRDLQQRLARKEKAVENARARQDQITKQVAELEKEIKESREDEDRLTQEAAILRNEIAAVSSREAVVPGPGGLLQDLAIALHKNGVSPSSQAGLSISVFVANALATVAAAEATTVGAPAAAAPPPPQAAPEQAAGDAGAPVFDLTAAAPVTPVLGLPAAVRRPAGHRPRPARRSGAPASADGGDSGRSRSGGSEASSRESSLERGGCDVVAVPPIACRSLLDMGFRRGPSQAVQAPVFQLGLQAADTGAAAPQTTTA